MSEELNSGTGGSSFADSGRGAKRAGGDIKDSEQDPLTKVPRLDNPGVPPQVSRLASAIWSKSYKLTDDSIELSIDDPKLVWFFGSKKLYIRHFYKDFWESVLEKGNSARLRGAVILGTPGIGKSAFGQYVLFQALSEGRTVIFNSSAFPNILCKGGQVFSIPPSQPISCELDDAKTIYICDSVEPKVECCSAFVLLVTSPKKGRWFPFSKLPRVCPSPFIFPVHSQTEINRLWELDFSDIPSETVIDHLNRFGGVPRHVLSSAYFGVDEEISNLASLFSVEQLISMLEMLPSKSLEEGAEQCHRLVHFCCKGENPSNGLRSSQPEYFKFSHTKIASAYLEALICDSLVKKGKSELYRFLHAASTSPHAKSLYGLTYETCIVAPALLAPPQSFSLRMGRPLDGFSPLLVLGSTLQTPQNLVIIRVKDLKELSDRWKDREPNVLFVPEFKNFPCADFILCLDKSVLFLNATVGQTHRLNSSSLQKYLDTLEICAESCAFLWLVPDEVYPSFACPHSQDIQQYVVCIPVPSLSKTSLLLP